METIKLNTRKNKIFIGLFTALLIFATDLQAKKVSFLNSSVVPAARGYAKITRDGNRNYIIKIRVTNLAEVSRLQEPKITYVVWMVNEEGVVKNLGQIDSSTSFLSKKLKASFDTATAAKPTQIFITAEDDPNRQIPGTQEVLTTKRF